MVAIDDEGVELADVETAREQAIEGARLICDQVRRGRINLGHRL